MVLAGAETLLAQGNFVNLNFEAAAVAPVPQGQSGSYVPISDGLPGWRGYWGSNEATVVLQNNYSAGSVSISILGPNFPSSTIIQGQYTALLQAGVGAFSEPGKVPAAIAQTGLVPDTAKSLIFKTSTFPYPTQLEVSLSLQPLLLIPLGTNANYFVFGADVSAFANQNVELRFAALSQQPLPFFSVSIDDISFSPEAVPEPSVLGLSAFGSLLLGWRLRRMKP